MIFLTNEHVQQVLDMPTCIQAMEDAYHELNDNCAPAIGRASISMFHKNLTTIVGEPWKAHRAGLASSPSA